VRSGRRKPRVSSPPFPFLTDIYELSSEGSIILSPLPLLYYPSISIIQERKKVHLHFFPFRGFSNFEAQFPFSPPYTRFPRGYLKKSLININPSPLIPSLKHGEQRASCLFSGLTTSPSGTQITNIRHGGGDQGFCL